MIRATRHGAALLGVLALFLLSACGDDDSDATLPSSDDPVVDEPDDVSAPDEGESTTPDDGDSTDDEQALVGDGACALLDADWLAENLSFEFGESVWEERPDAATVNRCRWFNDSKMLTLTVDLDDAARADLDGRRDDPTDGTTVEPLDSLAPGAFAVRDDFGERYFQVWVPLDGVALSVVVDVMQIETDEEFVAIAAEVLANAG
ncbi:MAG: hypothetical protein ACXIVQ_03460 [Acidimicrobiales bacterium]